MLPGDRAMTGQTSASGRRSRSKRHASLDSTIRRMKGASSRLELVRMLRVPPSPRDHDAVRHDPAVARQVLADNIDIIEASILDGQDRRIPDAAGPQAAELRSLQCECGVDGRG